MLATRPETGLSLFRLACLLLRRKVLFDVGLDSPEHEGAQDGVQLLDHVVAGTLVRLQACRLSRCGQVMKTKAAPVTQTDTLALCAYYARKPL